MSLILSQVGPGQLAVVASFIKGPSATEFTTHVALSDDKKDTLSNVSKATSPVTKTSRPKKFMMDTDPPWAYEPPQII